MHVSPIGGPPPSAGAMDLAALKALPLEHQIAMFNQQLNQNGILCDCGERIRDEAFMVFIRKENALRTPNGTGPGLAVTLVHSQTCKKWSTLLAQEDIKIIATRRVNEVIWLDGADIASS